MGAAWGKKVKQTKVLIVGLDYSGKSTVINHLKPEKEKVSGCICVGMWIRELSVPPSTLIYQENYVVQATVGFMVERFRYGTVLQYSLDTR